MNLTVRLADIYAGDVEVVPALERQMTELPAFSTRSRFRTAVDSRQSSNSSHLLGGFTGGWGVLVY
jgi:hypothetical protein